MLLPVGQLAAGETLAAGVRRSLERFAKIGMMSIQSLQVCDDGTQLHFRVWVLLHRHDVPLKRSAEAEWISFEEVPSEWSDQVAGFHGNSPRARRRNVRRDFDAIQQRTAGGAGCAARVFVSSTALAASCACGSPRDSLADIRLRSASTCAPLTRRLPGKQHLLPICISSGVDNASCRPTFSGLRPNYTGFPHQKLLTIDEEPYE